MAFPEETNSDKQQEAKIFAMLLKACFVDYFHTVRTLLFV